MKSVLSSILAFVSLTVLLSSCLGDNTTSSLYYDDAAITSVSLGTLSREVHTKSYNGGDSTYTTTVTGSNYPMYIDQAKRIIYNVDSLPKGTKTKGLITISVVNSAYVGIKSLTSDTIYSYSSSDSVDFSKPRTLRVQSNDNTTWVDYTLDIRIHKENPKDVTWEKKVAGNSMLALGDMQALAFGGKMYIHGTDATGVRKIFSTELSDGATWTQNAKVLSTDGSLTTDGSALYALSSGTLSKTTDGENWTDITTSAPVKTLITGNKEEIYGLGDDQILKSTDGGATWTAEELTDDATELPRYNIGGLCAKSKTNSNAAVMVLYGNRNVTTSDLTESEYNADDKGRIWTRTLVYGATSYQQPWFALQANNSDNKFDRYEHVCITPYGDNLLLLGDFLGILSQGIKISYDGGINWEEATDYSLPSDLNTETSSFGFASDGNGFLWLINGDGNVYRGRQAQQTWLVK